MDSDYQDQHLRTNWSVSQHHRSVIGGMWDEIGQLQFEYLKTQNLKPSNTLVDIGCGSLRGGSRFIPFLDSGNYYGFDINKPLIQAGLEKEVPEWVRTQKVVDDNFHAAAEFDFPESWQGIDTALSLSLFTHLTLNSIRLCLQKARGILKPKALYHSSVFMADIEALYTPITRTPDIQTYMHKDPYHYTKEDLRFAAKTSGYTLISISDFAHPRGQKMAVFQKNT